MKKLKIISKPQRMKPHIAILTVFLATLTACEYVYAPTLPKDVRRENLESSIYDPHERALIDYTEYRDSILVIYWDI